MNLRKIAALMVVGIFLIGMVGCAGIKNLVCSNRVTIENDIATAQAAIAAVEAEYPGLIPPAEQAIIIAANTVIANGEYILNNEICPSDTEVQSIQRSVNALKAAKTKAGMKF